MAIRGNIRALAALFGCFLMLGLYAGESNLWPLQVRQWDSPVGRPDHTGSLGPFFAKTLREETRILSFRPLWTSFLNQTSGVRESHILYPFLNWTVDGDLFHGHLLNLLQFRRDPAREEAFFQLFPFVFSNRTPEPDESYFAVWPIGGVLKNRLWRDRISFFAWPLFVQTVRDDETRTHIPYPFIQMLDGPHSRGFGIWPLYGQFARDNDYAHRWALWPFFYHYRDKLDEPVPYERFGVLPFYHRETAAGLKSETYVWPFFGYTREFEPRKSYSETRYFWPLLVQGRGEERHVNRWMPFYTREREPGYEKRWYMWPLLELESFEQPGLRRERTSFFYFLYRDERQHFADTTARLSFLWPLYGYWHDGHDRTQVQVFDPLSVFFPANRAVRENWSPLFALYRFDERSGNARHSLLWDLVVWERDPGGLKAFYAGPLFEWVEGSHWQVLKGLVRNRHGGESGGWNFFWRK